MNFLVWHYTQGFKLYLQQAAYSLAWVIHYFSLPLLLLTLFQPWKRQIIHLSTPGFSFQRVFEEFTFNLISRIIGAIVRIFFFFVGGILLILVLIACLIGTILWLALPLMGLPYYQAFNSQTKLVAKHLATQIAAEPTRAASILLSSPAGQFIASRLGLSQDVLIAAADLAHFSLALPTIGSFEDLISQFVSAGVWTQNFLHDYGLVTDDFIKTARWWDRLQPVSDSPQSFGQPGLGSELLFGFTPNLDQTSINLSAQQKSFSHHLIGRKNLVSRLERTLVSGYNVILTGLPGVGRKTVVLEFARRATEGQLDRRLVYSRVMELDYNFLLSKSADRNSKKTLLSEILREAVSAGNIILVIKDLHRLVNPEVEGLDLTDVFEEYLEKRHLKIIAISSQSDYERFLAPLSRLHKYFETVEVTPPSADQALEILMSATTAWEARFPIILTTPALRQIVQGSDKYISETPFPEKALEILDAVISSAQANSQKIITTDNVNQILSEKTGISFARLTSKEKNVLADLENLIHRNLINQTAAVSAIAKSLRARVIGTKDESRPIGSFLFLGPTGVGKTQTAKTLAQIYFGSVENILRFDMAEYQGESGIDRLIGSVRRNQPGSLTTAIKNHPASLLLLDEIEKSPSQIYNIFLTLLDEGQLTDAFDHKINCRNLFVIATSNAGAEYIRQLVTQGTTGPAMQEAVIDYVQKNHIFSPEFLNRFDGVVVYQPLGREELAAIARLMLEDLANQLQKKNITLRITPEICTRLAQDGYHPTFGARAMRRLVDLTLGDLLAQSLLREEIKSGDQIQLIPGNLPSEFTIHKI